MRWIDLEEYVIHNINIIYMDHIISNGYIYIKNGFIADIDIGSPPKYLMSKVEKIDGKYILPGFIDTHTHGIAGIDVTESIDPYKFLELAKHYVRHGVTSFLPTTVSTSHDRIIEVCKAIREAMSIWRPENGSRILGLHMEGPYINPKRAGAQNPIYIRIPTMSEVKNLLDSCGDVVKQISMAPEIENSLSIARIFVERGITVSAAHTDATYDEGLKAIENGFTKITHIFNGMREFHHREPGIALAFLQNEKTFIEVIADFIHLHKSVVKMIIDIAGPDRVVLITDSILATDMPDGIYTLGGLKVIVENGIARLEKGGLAGSTLTMDKAFRNIYTLGYKLPSVSKMLSTTPARSIKAINIGRIEKGTKADFVVLDNELNISAVFIDGIRIYR